MTPIKDIRDIFELGLEPAQTARLLKAHFKGLKPDAPRTSHGLKAHADELQQMARFARIRGRAVKEDYL